MNRAPVYDFRFVWNICFIYVYIIIILKYKVQYALYLDMLHVVLPDSYQYITLFKTSQNYRENMYNCIEL